MIKGFVIHGGFDVILLGGFVLTLMNLLVKPVLSLLTLPLNLLTMGLFSWVLNVALIYLLTILVIQISLSSFAFQGFQMNGFTIPQLSFSAFQTAIITAFMLSFIVNMTNWLFRK